MASHGWQNLEQPEARGHLRNHQPINRCSRPSSFINLSFLDPTPYSRTIETLGIWDRAFWISASQTSLHWLLVQLRGVSSCAARSWVGCKVPSANSILLVPARGKNYPRVISTCRFRIYIPPRYESKRRSGQATRRLCFVVWQLVCWLLKDGW